MRSPVIPSEARNLLFLAGLSLLAAAPAILAQSSAAPDYSQAETLVRHGRLDEGIAILRPLLASEPRNLKARNLLGIALTQKGDLPAADAEYAKALEVDPRFYPALSNLAINEFTLKDFSASEKHFQQAFALKPDDPVVNSFLGKVTFKRGEYARAAQYLRKAEPLFAQEPALAVALVQSELETGEDARALAL